MSTRMLVTFYIYNKITIFFDRYLDNSSIYSYCYFKKIIRHLKDDKR